MTTSKPWTNSTQKAKRDAWPARALKHVTSAALVAALVPLALMAAPTIASADPILLITSSATMTSGDAANPWRYVYTLTNQSTCTPVSGGCESERLVEFLVPLFSATDADFSSIVFTREDSFVTGGFFYNPAADPVLAANPGIYGPNPNAFVGVGGIYWHFNRTPLLVGESMELSFNSAYAPTNAPYMAVWVLGMPVVPSDTFGGPIAMPNSPAYQATQAQSVPEPTTLLLLAPAAAVLLRRRRQT